MSENLIYVSHGAVNNEWAAPLGRSHLRPLRSIVKKLKFSTLTIVRWDAPLFFANAELFQDRVIASAENSPTPVRWLVVAAEPVTSVDVIAADVLTELDRNLREGGIELSFAELKDPVKDKLKRFGLFKQIGEQSFFPPSVPP